MSEHEKLKEICDLIEHKPMYWYKNLKWFYQIMSKSWLYRKVNVTEIIFSPEFMSKYLLYISENTELELNKSYDSLKFSIWLLWNLNDPADYLYNLLRLWQK